jgi:hypothetical protein
VQPVRILVGVGPHRGPPGPRRCPPSPDWGPHGPNPGHTTSSLPRHRPPPPPMARRCASPHLRREPPLSSLVVATAPSSMSVKEHHGCPLLHVSDRVRAGKEGPAAGSTARALPGDLHRRWWRKRRGLGVDARGFSVHPWRPPRERCVGGRIISTRTAWTHVSGHGLWNSCVISCISRLGAQLCMEPLISNENILVTVHG